LSGGSLRLRVPRQLGYKSVTFLDRIFTFTAAAYNIVRLRRLLAPVPA
jgi:DMSO/TMAO reductase YedYZ molybdopterin-dependent catalytic subunit